MDPLNDLNRVIGQLEAKIDALTETVKHPLAEHTERLRQIELWQNSLNQKIAWVTGAFALFFSFLIYVGKAAITYIMQTMQGHN